MLIRRHVQHGFTLIELMIGIAIVGLLLTLALPNFRAWIQNMRIRASAEAILDGLQLAKAQAIRSNNSTEFVLIPAGTEPVAASIATAPAANGTNWIVRTIPPTGVYHATCPATEPTCDFIQGRSGQESSLNASIVAGPGSGGLPGSYVFTPLGRLLNPPLADVNIDVNSSNAYPDRRKMCIIISRGGQILMCDPNRVDPANPQFCPAGACP